MNAATLNSARLQRVLGVLRQPGPHSTLEIIALAQVCAVNSIIAELRENGAEIRCQQRVDPETKVRRFYYTMTKEPKT